MDRWSRRQFLQGSVALAGSGLLSGCGLLPAITPQPARVPRIGYLGLTRGIVLEAFQQGLSDHGYVEGRNIAVEYRFVEGWRSGCPSWPGNWLASRSRSS